MQLHSETLNKISFPAMSDKLPDKTEQVILLHKQRNILQKGFFPNGKTNSKLLLD